MSKKKQNLVLRVGKDDISSLVGNAGEFENCAGFMDALLKLSTLYLEEHKFSFTEDCFKCVYKGVLNALDGVRYPNKSGNEYLALLRIKKIMESEYKRQTSNVLSLSI